MGRWCSGDGSEMSGEEIAAARESRGGVESQCPRKSLFKARRKLMASWSGSWRTVLKSGNE